MKKKLYFTLSALGILGLLLSGCRSDQDGTEGEEPMAQESNTEANQQKVEIGEKAPTFKLESLDGEVYRLDEMQGTPVLLSFFGVNCSYCRDEMVDLNKLYMEKSDEAAVLLVNVGDQREQVESFVEEYGLEMPVLMDSDIKVSLSYNVSAVPYNMVVDEEGIIRAIKLGPMGYEEMKSQLESAGE